MARSNLKKIFIRVLVATAFCVAQFHAATLHVPSPEGAPQSRIHDAYGKLPLTFEQNQGQVNSQVKFLSRAPGYNLFLTQDEAVLVLRTTKSKVKRQKAKVGAREILQTNFSIGNEQSPVDNSHAVLRMKLVGANPRATVTGLNQVQGKSNYLIGNNSAKWWTNVAQFAKVKYQEIYPGVNLVYYGTPRQLEYDFVVAPGADPRAIVLDVGMPLRLDANGDLIVKTPAGAVRFRKPVIYQPVTGEAASSNSSVSIHHSELVEGRYVLSGNNQLRFEVKNYDPARPLVIDPVLSYSTYLGGTNLDYAYGLAVDSGGNAYVAGMTDSLDFPAVGSIQAAGGGTCTDDLKYPFNCFDAFVAKLNPTGTALVYSTFLGGSNDDRAAAIAVDSSGNAYVTGYTVSGDFPTANAFQSAFGGGSCGTSGTPCFDAFVAKLNATGSALVYSTYLGGRGNDIASGIRVDSLGAAYVVGSTSSPNFPVSPSPLQAVFGGGVYNAFITKLNPTGNTAAYSTYLGGSGEDHGVAIAVDASGDAFITGYTISGNFPTKVPLQNSWAGGTCGTTPCFDAFVSKLNPGGSALVYSTYLGGTGGDYGYGIAIDSSGDAFVTGLTTSTNFPVAPGAFQSAGGGTNYDAFVAKLNPAGSALNYSTYFGGSATEVAYGIAVDTTGKAYVAGYAYGQGMPLASPLQSSCNFQDDAFVAKISSSGSALIFSSYLGGGGNDVAQGVAVDSAGSVYLAGGTYSTDFPVTPGALKTTYGGGAYNAFVTKISGIKLPVTTLSQTKVLFANQGVGTTSPPSTVSLTNNGDAALNISSITANNDFAVTSDCGSVVATGASCHLYITFSPADFGNRTGTVTVTDNTWGSPHLISLSGGGITSITVSLSPSTLDFGNQPASTTSASLPATLANLGSATLNIFGISTGPGFNQTNNCPAAIPSGASCTIQVSFSPYAGGTFSSQLAVSDDAPAGNPYLVTLTGTGTGAGATFSSASLVFGDQYLSTTSTAQTVTVTSSGTANLIISGISTSGPFAQTSNCLGSLKVGTSCTINVSFKPITSGANSGSIVMSDNAYNSPQAVTLSGNGTVPPRQAFGVPLSPGKVHGKHKGKR
jgi:Beta-propeller repeat/HYDIN/CFA65/VesB-like, Ig-like domain